MAWKTVQLINDLHHIDFINLQHNTVYPRNRSYIIVSYQDADIIATNDLCGKYF